ncbi:MAG: hypothetical protein OIF50_15370, partial [Flavobacteriaceae bacterium]|nr:hypothetical protein [Flavobacteriaceae bacterium]
NQVEIQALVDLDNATDEIKAKIAKKLVCHNQLYAVPPNLLPAQTDTSPTVAEVAEGERHFSRCVCKNYDLIWGDKLNCSQRKKVVEVCKNLWGEAQKIEKANQLLAVMHLETGRSFSASADNENGYVGLIQFSSGAAASLGTSQRDLKQMTFVEQMDYVEKYLSKKKDKLNSMTDMYLQVLKPNAVGNGNNPDYIIFDESIPLPDGDGKNTSAAQRELNIQRDPWVKKLGYKSNPYFMVEEGEKKKREKWNYTKQKMELKEGFHGGKTAVWEVEQVLTNNHYLKGQANKFDGKCVDILINKMQEETAPWIIKAWREYFNYFGKREKDDPLKQRIKEYFYKTKNDGYDHKKAWCAAFVNFCFYLTSDYKHTNTKGTAGAYDWAEYSNDKVKNNEGKDGWKNGELSEPFIGAVIVFSFSHVAFIVGENLDGSKYVFLGGNQEGWEGKKSGTQIISLSSIDKNSNQIYRIMKPKGYEIPKSQKTLKKYDVETENSFDSTR